MPELRCGPKGVPELLSYTPFKFLKIRIAKYVHFCTHFEVSDPQSEVRALVEVMEKCSWGFAKLASFAKNTNMGWRRINFTDPGKEQKRWRISR